eukprot:16398-Heterococcus_DN1.PRE.3
MQQAASTRPGAVNCVNSTLTGPMLLLLESAISSSGGTVSSESCWRKLSSATLSKMPVQALHATTAETARRAGENAASDRRLATLQRSAVRQAKKVLMLRRLVKLVQYLCDVRASHVHYVAADQQGTARRSSDLHR